MPEWFVNLGTVTLTVMMVLFLLSVGVGIACIVYVIVKTLKDECSRKRGR